MLLLKAFCEIYCIRGEGDTIAKERENPFLVINDTIKLFEELSFN